MLLHLNSKVQQSSLYFPISTGSGLCHCYSDLHPFHCEEENGVALQKVYCLDRKKVPNSARPLLTVLSRFSSTTKSPPPAPEISGYSDDEEKLGIIQQETEFSTDLEQRTTLAAASGVLIITALIGLICLMCKTFQEEKRKKKNSSKILDQNQSANQTTYL